MNDTLELIASLLAFIVIVWPIAGFIWVMRWIRRQERKALAQLSQEESLS